MNSYTISFTKDYKSFKTIIEAEDRNEARELAEVQYLGAAVNDVRKEGEDKGDGAWELLKFALLTGGLIFFFSPAIVFYDLFTGQEVALGDKWGKILMTTIGFVLSFLYIGKVKGLLAYLTVCLVSTIGMWASWYFYGWDFFVLL